MPIIIHESLVYLLPNYVDTVGNNNKYNLDINSCRQVCWLDYWYIVVVYNVKLTRR